MIKLNAWEKKIRGKMERARGEENQPQKTYGILSAALLAFNNSSTHVVSALFFATMVAHDSLFTPAQFFTALILVERIKNRFIALMRLGACIVDGNLSLRKVDSYLRETRTESQRQESNEAFLCDGNAAVAIRRACFTGSSSSSDSSKVLFANVNLTIRRGSLTVIHDKTGTGKSTLLRTMLKEVRPLYGNVFVNSDCRIAYCPQELWLQTLSIRDNILFGSAFDEHKYRCVLEACCLLEDLTMLCDGDTTRVGPKGVNLSGGQKSRIALARACYADADLYVLDCPFASVDTIVQSDVFRKCIVDLLRFKTVVLVTHNPEMISSEFIDEVVTVSDTSLSVRDCKESTQSRGLSQRVYKFASTSFGEECQTQLLIPGQTIRGSLYGWFPVKLCRAATRHRCCAFKKNRRLTKVRFRTCPLSCSPTFSIAIFVFRSACRSLLLWRVESSRRRRTCGWCHGSLLMVPQLLVSVLRSMTGWLPSRLLQVSLVAS